MRLDAVEPPCLLERREIPLPRPSHPLDQALQEILVGLVRGRPQHELEKLFRGHLCLSHRFPERSPEQGPQKGILDRQQIGGDRCPALRVEQEETIAIVSLIGEEKTGAGWSAYVFPDDLLFRQPHSMPVAGSIRRDDEELRLDGPAAPLTLHV